MKPPEYEFYPAKGDEDQTPAWQEKQAAILKAYYEKRLKFRWAILGIVAGVIVLAGLIYGGAQWLGYTQELYGRGYRAWSGNCLAAGGLPAGPYSNTTAQVCVFPNGAQLTRTIPM